VVVVVVVVLAAVVVLKLMMMMMMMIMMMMTMMMMMMMMQHRHNRHKMKFLSRVQNFLQRTAAASLSPTAASCKSPSGPPAACAAARDSRCRAGPLAATGGAVVGVGGWCEEWGGV